MKFQDFQTKIKNLPVFTLNDVRKIDPNFHQPQLMYWLKNGYIRSFAGEYYIMPDVVPNERVPYIWELIVYIHHHMSVLFQSFPTIKSFLNRY